ncbi:MAG: hypothetical protein WBB82_13710 [Limnothrix sp.]
MTKALPIVPYLRHSTGAEQEIYDYLIYAVQTQTPDELLPQFQHCFIEGRDATNDKLRNALHELLNTPGIDQDFKYVLNRCCHIIVNRWQIHPQLQKAIPQLVELFNAVPPPSFSGSRFSRRLRQLVIDFLETEQYLTLKRLSRVIEQGGRNFTWNDSSILIGQLIQRYPYLYEHCLLSEDSNIEHQQTVRQVQSRIQRSFELDLSKYVTYQVRLAQLARRTQSMQQAKKMLKGVDNPTLLTERELGNALKRFVGKPERGHSYHDLSRHFLRRSAEVVSYQEFKEELFGYLISSVDSKYGNLQFNQQLYGKLQSILPKYDGHRPNELLMMRTTSQLLNFLVVESPQQPEHYVFVDMITNLGPTATVALLLKLVLMCGKAKPHLERRFSILFSHYEAQSKEGVPWLVKSLENLHIALSVHFGDADVSFLKQIM